MYVGGLRDIERNCLRMQRERGLMVTMNAFFAWNYKYRLRINQRQFMLALHDKRKLDLLVTAFSTWRRLSLASRANELESIIRSNRASTHLNKCIP
jgi:hypothetical protein